MSEASKLALFLLGLETSRSALARFKKDPVGEMLRFDLAPATIQAVFEQDTQRLWTILRIPTVHVGAATGVHKGRGRRKSKRA
jgi:hypothetical protein